MQPRTIERAVDKTLSRFGAVPLLLVVALALLLPGFVTLPPMDRDEPRFAQASKQMLETGDFVDIRFGEEARNKKPIGIHWMQAAVVGLADAAHVLDARQKIWLYRIPSLIGALVAVLLTYWAALPFVSRRGAVVAGVLMAATPLLGAEARLATTDAVLVATVVAAMGALARVFLPDMPRRSGFWGVPAIFWIAVGVGILIKGPINPMILVFAILVLSIGKRSIAWLAALHPRAGLALCLLIVVPWFLAILLKTNGTFFTDAVGHDLLGKIAGAQEMHGAPPGFYIAAFWLTAWPIAPFAALAAPMVWRERRDPRVVILLAWIVPAWLVFEAVPTKLVHYGLPLYPAIAILAVFGLERTMHLRRAFGAGRGAILFCLLALMPAATLGIVMAGADRVWTLDRPTTIGALAVVSLSVLMAWIARNALLRQRLHVAGGLAALCAFPLYLFVAGWLLSPGVAPSLAVSPRLVDAASEALDGACPAPLYATVGSREPSLMFVTNAKLLMTDAAGAAQFLMGGPCRIAFVEKAEEPAFQMLLDPATGVREGSRVGGVAINGGRRLDIGVYIRQ